MKTLVHANASRQNCGRTGNRNGSKIFFIAFATLLGLVGSAQTYTTIAAGNWNSASNWAGGAIPGNVTAAGKIVNIGHAVNLNVNSDVTIAGTVNIIRPAALPHFTAALDKQKAVLNWSVASEENLSHFVVERSTDGRDYSPIATIFAMGAPAYAFKDTKVPTGVAYYRLVMIDMTKGFSLSKVRVVRTEKETEMLTLSTYPNPATDQVSVALPAAWHNKPVSLELITASGIRVQTISIGNAASTETMPIVQASKGVYIIKASCGNETGQQRVIKN